MGLSAAFKLPAGFGAASAIPQTAPVPVQRAPSAFSPEEERILNLLADGHLQETVAATLGLTPSAISQHLSKDFFRNELASRKALRLQKYKELDNGYDDVERDLLERLKSSTFMLTRPLEITAALSRINGMKRRVGSLEVGNSSPVNTVVNITLPVQVIQKITTTSDGHVVGVDSKSLVTIPSHQIEALANERTQEVLSGPANSG